MLEYGDHRTHSILNVFCGQPYDRIVSWPAVLPDRDRRSFMGLVRPFVFLFYADLALVAWRIKQKTLVSLDPRVLVDFN